jgi:tetratricopeptide (TPR) repeat protein
MALSSTASRDGRHDIALAYLEEVRGLADSLDDHRRGTFLFDLAHSYRETGDYEGAIRTGIASLALFRATAYELGSAALEDDLALSFLALGNLAKAEEFASSSQKRFERLNDRRWLAYVLGTRALIALAGGDGVGSRELASSALSLAEETHNDKAAVSALLALARADRALGDPSAASASYERAVDLARGSSRPSHSQAISEVGRRPHGIRAARRAAGLLREALGPSEFAQGVWRSSCDRRFAIAAPWYPTV